MTSWQDNPSPRPLSKCSTLGVGGPAQHFVTVRDVKAMQSILRECSQQRLRYLILGKGSNCLFDDRGFLGVVIQNKIDFLEEPKAGVFHVGAGYRFALLGAQTAHKGWTGLEFAAGVPGTVGGAIFMNAGANGMETAASVVSVDFVDETGGLHLLNKDQLGFGYRTSTFHHLPGAIVGATFTLRADNNARNAQTAMVDYRKKTQPYRDKSAGCMFRNPPGEAAGALIDRCGLKGYQIGGAQVSPVHANFLVNTGTGSSNDIKSLLTFVKEQVKAKTGIELEQEIRVIDYQ